MESSSRSCMVGSKEGILQHMHKTGSGPYPMVNVNHKVLSQWVNGSVLGPNSFDLLQVSFKLTAHRPT